MDRSQSSEEVIVHSIPVGSIGPQGSVSTELMLQNLRTELGHEPSESELVQALREFEAARCEDYNNRNPRET